jgi:MarR family transcriptional regulator, organic hydroperoxide resistance regulator
VTAAAPDLDDPLQLELQMCFPLYAATRLVVQAYRPLLAELGLTYPQYLVMLVLWREDGLAVGEVGAKLLLDSGTLTPLLKRLEKQGLVVRRRSREDERTVRSYLTPTGDALRQRARSIPEELLLAAKIDPTEVVAVREVVRSMLRTLVDYHGLDFDETPPDAGSS